MKLKVETNKRFSGADLQMMLCVSHQVIDLIGQVDLLICVLQSFIIVLEHREGLSCDSTMRMLLDDQPETFTHLLNDLHLFLSPLRFVLLCIDKELNHLLLQLVCGI